MDGRTSRYGNRCPLLPPILLIASHTHTFRCENPVPCGTDSLLGDAHDAAHGFIVHAHFIEDEGDGAISPAL